MAKYRKKELPTWAKIVKWVGITLAVAAGAFFVITFILACVHNVSPVAEWKSWIPKKEAVDAAVVNLRNLRLM